MDESLKTIVVDDSDPEGKEAELEIKCIDGAVLEFYLNEKKVFSGDWDGNFNELFKRALEIWDEKNE